MALERVPADIRAQGGVARMSDPQMIKEIMETVTIPVMAKARIGHFVECQVRLTTHTHMDNLTSSPTSVFLPENGPVSPNRSSLRLQLNANPNAL